MRFKVATLNNDLFRIALWALATLALQTQWIETALLLALFVLVPKAAALDIAPGLAPRDILLEKTIQYSFVPAIFAATSFAFSPGFVGSILVIPWLIFTFLWLVCGLRRFFSRTSVTPRIISDAAFIFIFVGGNWLFISRLGAHPLNFSSDIVKLTAIHFHYAGFIVPIVVAQLAHTSKKSWIVPVLVLAGIPLTAAGITFGGTLNLVGALVMASGGLGTAFLLGIESIKSHSLPRKILLMGAGLSVAIAMCLAIFYALALHFLWDGPTISQMARWHGGFNSLGFGVFAIWGLSLPDKKNLSAETTSPRSCLLWLHRPTLKELDELYAFENNHELSYSPRKITSDSTTPAGFVHKHWSIEIGTGRKQFDRACEALILWKGHDAAKINRTPELAPLELGQHVTLAIPALGVFFVTAMCEIVDVVKNGDQFGFAYGTMSHHPESGEERFVISISNDDSVRLNVDAVFHHSLIGIKLVSPIASYLQGRAIKKYLSGIRDYALGDNF